jgi:male germ cell-associated kinase
LFPGSNDFDQLGRVVKVLGTPEVGDWPEGFKLAKSMGSALFT